MYCDTSYDKCTYCKSLWIKESAKCPKCKCKCNGTGDTEAFVIFVVWVHEGFAGCHTHSEDTVSVLLYNNSVIPKGLGRE